MSFPPAVAGDFFCSATLTRGGWRNAKSEQFPRQALLHSAEQQAQALRGLQRHFGDRGAFGGGVANKRDLPEIIKSVKAGRLRRTCHIPSYSDADKGLSLSDVDLAELNAALAERGIVRPSPKKRNLADCMRKTYIFRQVNLWNMTVYPCCGFSEPPIPLSEWNLQNPSGKVCENCPKLSYD